MIESIILGAVQGIAEWLPVSSEGFTVLVAAWFSGGTLSVPDIIRFSLFLHLGTFLAALVYLRRDVWMLLQGFFWRTPDAWTRHTARFLIVSTGVSGIVGIILLFAVGEVSELFAIGTKGIMAAVGILLLVTGLMQVKRRTAAERLSSENGKKLRLGDELSLYDGVLLGLVQGLSVLPGISRSGSTVAVLLLRNIDDTEALRLSFLMSLPIVFAGNIALNAGYSTQINSAALAALVSSFIFGLLSIHALLYVARRVNFGRFVVVFGFLVLVGAFL